jgi:hypothetical protein
MIRTTFVFLVAVCGILPAQSNIVATGLESPQRFILTPAGNFLASEASVDANSGRLTFVTRGGQRRVFFVGLPSGATPNGEATGPTGMAVRGHTLYVAIGIGESERRGTQPRTSQHNPEGIASPILSSVLEIRLSADVDSLMGTFRLTPEQQQLISDGYSAWLEDGAGGFAMVRLLADFPNSIPDATSIYRFSNPWSIALSLDGRDLWVADASHNALVRVDVRTGQWRRVIRFPALANPGGSNLASPEAVPTSVRVFGNKVIVSLLTGSPVVPGLARVLVGDPQTRTVANLITGLSSAIDVLWVDTPESEGRFFVLEFSRDRTARPPAPGRLLRYSIKGSAEVVADNLTTPLSLAYDPSSQELFVLDLTGQISLYSGK